MRTGVTLYIRTNGKFQQAIPPTASKPHPQTGSYYLRFEVNGKRKWECVGEYYLPAFKALKLKEIELLSPTPSVVEPTKPTVKTLLQLRDKFLAHKNLVQGDNTKLAKDTITGYELVTLDFLTSSGCTYPEDITQESLLGWITKERARVSNRTVCNRYHGLTAFLTFCGLDHKNILPKNLRPRFTEDQPVAYTPEEMVAFFKHVDKERDLLAFEFLLLTGARECEMSKLEWIDLQLGPKPCVMFHKERTKTKKGRRVPLEKEFAEKLVAWRVKNPTTRLVFGNPSDQVYTRFLESCKRAGVKAGFKKEDFWLHKFRSSFATWALQRGVDIRTVQNWLGHSSILMTQKYLSPATGELEQSGINNSFGNWRNAA